MPPGRLVSILFVLGRFTESLKIDRFVRCVYDYNGMARFLE